MRSKGAKSFGGEERVFIVHDNREERSETFRGRRAFCTQAARIQGCWPPCLLNRVSAEQLTVLLEAD